MNYQLYDRSRYRYLVKTDGGGYWSWFKTDGTRMTEEQAASELKFWRTYSTNEYAVVKYR